MPTPRSGGGSSGDPKSERSEKGSEQSQRSGLGAPGAVGWTRICKDVIRLWVCVPLQTSSPRSILQWSPHQKFERQKPTGAEVWRSGVPTGRSWLPAPSSLYERASGRRISNISMASLPVDQHKQEQQQHQQQQQFHDNCHPLLVIAGARTP